MEPKDYNFKIVAASNEHETGKAASEGVPFFKCSFTSCDYLAADALADQIFALWESNSLLGAGTETVKYERTMLLHS